MPCPGICHVTPLVTRALGWFKADCARSSPKPQLPADPTEVTPVIVLCDDQADTTGATAMKIVTSLSFQGQCREAFDFYAKVLGGKITAAIPYGDGPPGMPITDAKYKTWLMH